MFATGLPKKGLLFMQSMRISRMTAVVASAITCLTSTATFAQNDDRPTTPLPYLQPSPEEGFITRTLLEGRRYHRDFTAAFDDASPGCSRSVEPFFAAHLHFFKHGAAFDFGGAAQGRASIATLMTPDASGYVGVATFPNCVIQIDFRKSVLRDARWIAAKTVDIADINDRDERETHYYRLAPIDRRGAMNFLFETADDDDCVRGGGMGVLRPHSMLSELSDKFRGSVERRTGTRYSNDYTIEHGRCRYEMSILQYVKDDVGVLHPVPVSKIFAAFAGPPPP